MSVQKARQGYKLVKWLFGKEIEIPEEWRISHLEDGAEIKGRVGWKGYTQEDFVEKGHGAISLGANNISKENKLDLSELTYVTWSKYDESPEIQVSKNDIILAQRGSIGKVAIIEHELDKTTINPNVVLIKNFDFDNYFLYYVLTSENITKQMNRVTSSTTIPLLTQCQIKKFRMPIPDKSEQQKIASILSNVDSLIDQTQKIIDQTIILKKGLMQKLLTRGIGHTKFKKVKWLFGKEIVIPEEWKMENLMNLGEPVIGLTYEPDNVKSAGILVLRAPNIQDGKLRFDDNVYVDVELMDRLKIRKGDLLICVRNGSKQLIGKCALVDRNFDNTTFGAFMSVFRSKENPFIYYQFQTPLIRKQITKSLTFTINQITNKDLNSFILPIPPTDEQQKIVSILSAIDSKIAELESKKSNLQKLKKGLMQKLLTGQMRVKV